MNIKRVVKAGGGLWIISSLLSCSMFQQIGESLPDYRADYKKSNTLPSLEIPPELNTAGVQDELVVPDLPSKDNTTLSGYNQRDHLANVATPVMTPAVLPLADKVEIKREGKRRWLVMQAELPVVWNQVKAFWADQGFLLTQESPKTGIMETEWKENRSTIPEDGIRKYLGKALDMVYGASTRDKFRVRLERGSTTGVTEIYLTHRGAEEVAQGDNFVWQNRPTDPELEAEMLNRLLIFLGKTPQQAKAMVTATKTQTTTKVAQLVRTTAGQTDLLIQQPFSQSWQSMGLALDRLGFTIEDRDRAKGLYFIRYIDPDSSQKEKGFFSGLFGGGEDNAGAQEYQLRLQNENTLTRITLLNKQGQRVNDKTSERILLLLQEQFQ